jgi:hypothetical protein
MTEEGEDRFRPRPGRIRSLGGRRAKTFLSRLAREVSRAGGSPRLTFGVHDAPRTGRGGNAGFARRVIVKARIVRLDAAGLRRQAAHLAYIQRDGVAKDASPARLYDARSDEADGKAFAERSEGDRHQFRFIVSPEDGRALADLKPFVRDLMREAERDLGTRLEWVAADHYDTGHPHAHVVVRGRTDQGEDLVIPRAYITHGLRRRASELVTRELGPETAVEAYEKLIREETQERYRNGPVFIRRSMHVPLGAHAVRDAMPTFFELLTAEPDPSVRIVLGHFVFVTIHPYFDGNGRMGRFLMNAMMAAAGHPWTVIRLEDRDAYMAALEAASVGGDIRPFTDFIASAMRGERKERLGSRRDDA